MKHNKQNREGIRREEKSKGNIQTKKENAERSGTGVERISAAGMLGSVRSGSGDN